MGVVAIFVKKVEKERTVFFPNNLNGCGRASLQIRRIQTSKQSHNPSCQCRSDTLQNNAKDKKFTVRPTVTLWIESELVQETFKILSFISKSLKRKRLYLVKKRTVMIIVIIIITMTEVTGNSK